MKTYDELKALIEQRGVHAEFGNAGEGWGIEQSPTELAIFLVRMQELGVQSVLEIGTGYKGGLSRFLAQDMGWDVTTYDIQSYGHVFTGVNYIVGAKPTLDRQFDLVFIDGNHSYDAVKWDYTIYANLATKAIAFHDIAGLRGCEGVARLWRELAYWQGNLKAPNYMDAISLAPNKSGIGWIEL